jgi:hypothetical protein
MALTLDATAGSASSNSYATLASASDYLQQNIHTYTAWSSLSTANAEACLIWATTLLDSKISWNGSKAEDEQALRWPRISITDPDGYAVDDETVPKFLIEATAEYARWLSVEDRTAESPTKGFSRLEAGGIAAYINAKDRPTLIPPIVFDMITAYGTLGIGGARVLVRR